MEALDKIKPWVTLGHPVLMSQLPDFNLGSYVDRCFNSPLPFREDPLE